MKTIETKKDIRKRFQVKNDLEYLAASEFGKFR